MEEKETQPLIEILKCDDYNTKKKGQAKFKGKRINQKLISLCEKDFLEVKMPAETAFDFMARQLPDHRHGSRSRILRRRAQIQVETQPAGPPRRPRTNTRLGRNHRAQRACRP